MTDSDYTQRIGTVVCTDKDPNVMNFSFVVEGNIESTIVRRGEFVIVVMSDGIVIARVQDLTRTNRYFQQAEAVREYQSRGEPLRAIFPTDRWQYTVAQARVMGVWAEGRSIRPYMAVSPGATVRKAEPELLAKFLKLDTTEGLDIGTIAYHELRFKPSVTRLLSKHLAVLAMSGAGKSYFVSVLLEEILSRSKEQGRLATIVIDTHGEYTYLTKIKPELLNRSSDNFEIEHLRGSHIQIPVSTLSAEAIASLVAGMSGVQVRDLRRSISEMKAMGISSYTLADVINHIKDDETISKNTREALIGWIATLDDTGLFGKDAVPEVKNIVRPGKITLIDLSDFISLKKKQIVVSHIIGELLYHRRQGKIPPFLLVLEEAHQFCPESRKELALPKSRIETIAREGRKFHALLCLITQRPVRLSTTVLSQCSNQVILKMTNPYDLDHVGRSSEGIDRPALDTITTLEVGEALFVGETVAVPTFVKIRRRKYDPQDSSDSLLEAIRKADR